MKNNYYSILIPVFNGESTLLLLINSIKNLKFEPKKFEVIFIDNNSTDNSPYLIKEFIKNNESLNITYLFFNKLQSSYASRNFGVKNSKGNVLVFTDADCRLDCEYLNVLEDYSIHNNNNNILLGGQIIFDVKNKYSLWENYDQIASLQNEFNAKMNKSVTANMVCNIDVFKKTGEFKERTSGGDFEWSKRTLTFGYKLNYLKDMIVYHPTRKTFYEIKKKLYRFGIGWGEEIIEHNTNIIIGFFKHFLRIFYFKTNIHYTKRLKNRVSLKNLIFFNFCFLYLRVIILKGVYEGVLSALKNK